MRSAMQLVERETDFISDLLSLLKEFTTTRRRILMQNIRRVHQNDHIPCDLAVKDFSNILNEAITEYLLNQRLILRDTDAIHFGPCATVDLTPVRDDKAKQLLMQSKADYIGYQCQRLTENSMNEKMACKLMQLRQGYGHQSNNVSPHS